MTEQKTSPARHETDRQAIRAVIAEAAFTAHEISEAAGVPEREVAGHLESISRSAKHRGERLIVEPARCETCRFTFRERKRLSTPSRCPNCRSERIHPPRFKIE